MQQVISMLGEKLPRDTRDIFTRRCDVLIRQLHYFAEKADKRVRRAGRAGWSVRKLEVLLALNAFYQTVLAPLASSARPTRGSFLSEVDVVYGDSLVVDRQWRREIGQADSAFLMITATLEIPKAFLIAQRTEDVLYQVGKADSAND